VFTDLNNSFEFEDGYDFVVAKESNGGTFILPILVFGLVAVPLGIAFLAFAGWKRRAAADEEPLDVLPAGPPVAQSSTAIRSADKQSRIRQTGPTRQEPVH
jgi:hypothetical protein